MGIKILPKKKIRKKPKLIKPLFNFYQALTLDLAHSELKMKFKKYTHEEELDWMYNKGSVDTYKTVIDILVMEKILMKRPDLLTETMI